MKNNLKTKALELRTNGYSFREISERLEISKSTASLWTRHVKLNISARDRILSLSDIGRERAVKTKKMKRELIWKDIANKCSVLNDFRCYGINDYKVFIALLYWAEGEKTKRKFAFINSDPDMIKLYLFLLRQSFLIDERLFSIRLYLHEYHDKEKMLSFWSNTTGVCKNQFSVYNKAHTGKNKKIAYPGCLSIVYRDSRILKEIFIIIKRISRLR
jgi:hypothetical protein